MGMQNFFILTDAENTAAVGLDADLIAEVSGRAVDNASPGVGLNLNDAAANYAPGDPVTLTGALVVPKAIVDDPLYQSECPDLLTFLLTMPWASLETETIFAPTD